MKYVLFAMLAILVSATVFAQAQPQTGQQGNQAQNFQERKQHMLDRMDKRIAALQKARSCVAQAQDKDAVKQCFPEHEGHHGGGHHDGDGGKSNK